jgi:hypothetical protein
LRTTVRSIADLVVSIDFHRRRHFAYTCRVSASERIGEYRIVAELARTAASTTYQAVHADAGFEADECYVLGAPRDGRPDLALEVVWTSGGLQKLDVYRAFGVPEVWIWQQGELRAFVLEAGEYRPAAQSRLLPGAPLELLAAFAERTEQIDSDTLREFQAALRTGGRGRPLPS